MFHAMYGETADPVQGILDSIYPDLGECLHIAFWLARLRIQGGSVTRLGMASSMDMTRFCRSWRLHTPWLRP